MGYQWNAKEYAKSSSAQAQWADELIQKLQLKGDETLLDAGCGDGKITAKLAALLPNGRAVGIDNSEQMIRLAESTFNSDQYRNLDFRKMDVRKITFRGGFHLIFSNACLHWIKDHQPVLQGFHQALKTGGRMLLQMGGKDNAKDVVHIVENLIQSNSWKKYFDGFEFPYGFHDSKDYREWLFAAGFKPVRVQLIPKDMVHQNTFELAGWIRTTWLPYIDRVPDDLREIFIDKIVRNYLDEFPTDRNGSTHVEMVRLEVEAVKL